MNLLWAVSALLLGCWRANASAGKNFLSAMFVEDTDFALTTNIKNVNFYSCLLGIQQMCFSLSHTLL